MANGARHHLSQTMMRCFIFAIVASVASVANALPDGKVLDPWVEVIPNVFSKEDCLEIIRAAEEHGFPEDADSIDYGDDRNSVSWAIDVVLEQQIVVESLANLHAKYLDKLKEVVSQHKIKWNNGDTSEPVLDWVFLRKYTAGEERRMLKLHHDVNLFTINIALNDDYRGGGIFYHKPRDSYYTTPGSIIPNLPAEVTNYEYLENIKRENSSEIVFPEMKQGSLIIYNFSLWHAIAPLEKGTRYSLVYFYDMHHPDVSKLLSKDVEILLINQYELPVNIYEIVMNTEQRMVLENLAAESRIRLNATNSHRYLVVNSASDALLEYFDVFEDVGGEQTELPEYVIGTEGSDNLVIADLVNNFQFPVDLYWINPDTNEPLLVEENLDRTYQMKSFLGHVFEVVSQKSGNVVHVVELTERDKDLKCRMTFGNAGDESEFHVERSSLRNEKLNDKDEL